MNDHIFCGGEGENVLVSRNDNICTTNVLKTNVLCNVQCNILKTNVLKTAEIYTSKFMIGEVFD